MLLPVLLIILIVVENALKVQTILYVGFVDVPSAIDGIHRTTIHRVVKNQGIDAKNIKLIKI